MTHRVVCRFFALVVCLLTAGCSAADGCIGIPGPCVSLTSTTPTVTFIVGFDMTVVDGPVSVPVIGVPVIGPVPVNGFGFRAVLPVGATVTLHAVQSVNGDIAGATFILGTVTWTLSDSTAATLTPASDGSAQLLATHAGRVGRITANGTSALYACSLAVPRVCTLLEAIDVIVP
jgi:hypothetical protein